jgi:anti-sigma-K factor RskA
MASLAGTPEAPGALARLAYDRATGRAILFASGLPAAPEGKAYQVWYIAAGRPPMPGRVFKTDARGRGSLRDQMPEEGRAAANTFAVTLEPEGGVSAPTGKMYLLSAAS